VVGRYGLTGVDSNARDEPVRDCSSWPIAARSPTTTEAPNDEGRPKPPLSLPAAAQSACLRRNAGISISSMPLLASASTLAAACERALRHTLGVFSPV